MEQLVTVITEDLRMALVLSGVGLLGLIVLWEVVQRRRARRAEKDVLKGPLGVAREGNDRDGREGDGAVVSDPLFRAESAAREEPKLTLPEISTRDRLVEPPLIDFDVAIDTAGSGPGLPLMRADPEDPAPKIDAPQPVEPATGTSPPRLELPDEDHRVIVALRVVARNGERFTGASLRQALQGEGFVHGDMSIFHRAVADGRILLSAASLTKPGNFDLATMDSSLFLGINVFAVLPGPLPGRDTVDKLLLAGHTLAQRLKGELHDSKGQSLSEARLAEMRREAAAAAS